MKIKPFNMRANRINRLVQKIGRRLDREYPKRKMRKMICGGLGLALFMLGLLINEGIAAEVILAVMPLILLIEEYLRLKGRAPRRLWREVMLLSGCCALAFAIFPCAMLTDKEAIANNQVFILIYLVVVLLTLLLFGYAWLRIRRIKRVVAEEKELIRQRYERQRRYEKLNAL